MGRPRTQPTTLSLRCSICNQDFGRQEHLTRHLRIHTREKPYRCSLCDKRFSRLDVLGRHRASHEERDAVSSAPISSRACRQCATDRVRCSRSQPCKRCSERSLPCWYPSTDKAACHNDSNHVQSHMVQDVDTFMNERNIDPLEEDLETQTLPTVNNCATDAAFSCVTTDSTADPMGWPITMDNIPTLYEFDQPSLGVLGVNWISPQYHAELNWDALLDGLTTNPQSQGVQDGQTEVTALSNEVVSTRRAQDSLPTGFPLNIPEANHANNHPISSPSSEGRYYVDGHGARAPFGGRIHDRDSASVIEPRGLISGEIDSPRSVLASNPSGLCLPKAYENLIQAASFENDRQQLGLDLSDFPSYSQTQVYVQHYFVKFHPIFPFIRKASFRKGHSNEWLLLLAVAVVGSRYVQQLQDKNPGQIMLRLLAATLHSFNYGSSTNHSLGHDNMMYVPGQQVNRHIGSRMNVLQAGILNIICLLHSGKEQFVQSALVERHHLVEICHSSGLLSRSNVKTQNYMAQGADSAVNRWLVHESEIRLGMMIWFLDSMFLYEFDAKPLIDLDDIKATLPSHEDLWESPSLDDIENGRFSSLSLPEALETIYMEKRLPHGLSEFSISILIMAVYRNTYKIMLREQNRLNSWTPSAVARPRSDHEQPPAELAWLPVTPIASKWRNSACDCLDIIHWPANSKAAQSSGSEHHTILQLHLARVIILTPTTYIQVLANTTALQVRDWENPETRSRFCTARSNVLQWIVRDRSKARLSIIHCGALYWHIRRYSCDSVLEPYAIFIATLVLWAFSASLQLPEVVEAVSESCENTPEPSFLHLDRPIDDELVQTFVRVGHKVSAHMSKVGNILDASAPNNILREGISLLQGGSRITVSGLSKPPPSPASSRFVWGVEESYSKLLSELLDATAEDPGVSVF